MTTNSKKLKVLLAESDDDIAHFGAKMLEIKGFIVFKAYDKKTALEILETQKPEIMILEIRLDYSIEDGIEVFKKAKEINNTEIIIMTCVKENELKFNLRKHGIACYLNKPLYPNQWLPQVHEAAQRIRDRRTQ